MRTFVKTTQDASIYQRLPFDNSGLDEILEVGKWVKPTDADKMYATGSVRTLLNFNLVSGSYTSSAQYYLNLHIADAKFVNRYQAIEICPISRSWIEGSGYFYQDNRNVEDGVTWEKATRLTSWSNAGSDFTTTTTASYTFSEVPISSNIRINVTNLIGPVIQGVNTTPWNGLIVKLPNVDEIDQSNKGNIKFFSGNTHTVYEPLLEVVWNDQVFITGSLKPIPNSNLSIVPKNIKQSYTSGEVDKIYLVVRDLYPDKRFDAVQRYRNMYYLPSQSYFRIRDVAADVELFRFDAYSAINCDASGSYIILDTNGLNINRYYNIDLKIQSQNLVFFPEFNYTFKIDSNE
jgi:hypothetical protein